MNLLSVAKTVTKSILPNIAKYGKKVFGETSSVIEKSNNFVRENVNESYNNSIFSGLKKQMTKTNFGHELTNLEEGIGKNLHEKKFFGGFGDIVKSLLPKSVGKTAKKIIKKGETVTERVAQAIKSAVSNKDTSILDTFKTKLNEQKDKILGNPFAMGKAKMTGYSSGVNNLGKRTSNGVSSMGNKILSKSKSVFKNICNNISKVAQKAFNTVKNGFSSTVKSIKTTAQNIYKDVVKTVKTAFKSGITKINSVKIIFKNIVAKIKSGIKKVNKFLESKNTRASKNITKSNKDSQLIKKKVVSTKSSSKTSVKEPQLEDRYQPPVVKTKKENPYIAHSSKENVTNREIVSSNKTETHLNTSSSNPFIRSEAEFDAEIQQLFQITKGQNCKAPKNSSSIRVCFAKTNKINFSKYQTQYGMGAFEKCIKDNGAVRTVISVLNDANASDINISKSIKWLISNPQKQTDVIMNLNGNNLSKALEVLSQNSLKKIKNKTLINAYATKIKDEKIENRDNQIHLFVA